ncbi:MAG TPA: hypothetical protein VGB88_13395 [Alphaproteobacteria bacterium]
MARRFVTVWAGAGLLCLGASAVQAMPLEHDWLSTPGVTQLGTLDIKEVMDNSTEMEMRLSKQIMVLQQQILDLRRELDAVRAAQQR